jgi:hypothetical protein
MSDNRRRDNREDRREEPRKPPEEKKSGGDTHPLAWFWNTKLGKALFYYGLNYVLPTDKIVEQVVLPGTAAAESLLNLGKIKLVQEPLDWLRAKARKTLLIGAITFFVSLLLALYGIKWCNGYVVAAAGGLWTAYLLYVRVQICLVGKTVATLASFGLDLAKSVLGRLLHAVGIARSSDEGLSIDVKAVDDIAILMKFAISVSLIVTAILSGVAFISTTTHWLPVGLLLLGAVAALAALSLSNIEKLGIDTIPTWRGLNKNMKYLAYVAMVAAGVIALLPSLAQRLRDWHNGADGWVATAHPAFQPWMLIALPALLVVIGKIASAYYGKAAQQKSDAWKAVAKCALCAIPFIIGIMAYTGTLTYPKDVRGPVRRFATGSLVAAETSSPRAVAPLAPAPKPDFKGRTSQQILDDLTKE